MEPDVETSEGAERWPPRSTAGKEVDGDDHSERDAPLLRGGHWAVRSKGAVPHVAIGVWCGLHCFVCALLLFHGSLQATSRAQNGVYAASTLLAGVLYVALVTSDPGYVSEAEICAQLAGLRARGALGTDLPLEQLSPAACERSSLLRPQRDESIDLECRAPAVACGAAIATDAELAALFCGECTVCRIPRPLRSKHCRHCNRCVWRYDHHCFLISNCVGEANHALFWWFLLAQAVSVWHTIPLVLWAMKDDPNFWVWLAHTGPLFLCSLVLWPAGIFVTLLLLVHSAMALVDTTSYESAKHDKLEYMRDVPECAHPFADALPCVTLARFCAGPRGGGRGTLVPRPPPFRSWKATCWRNRYYSCC